MYRFLLTVMAAGVLSLPVAATDTLTCNLTGKSVDSCCCVKADNGSLHCKLADKDVKKCCCTHKM
jgi:hypothetical protein